MNSESSRLISREEFSYALDAFLMEMTGIVVAEAERTLASSDELRFEYDESLRLLRDPTTTREEALSLALGMVDEFVKAKWDHVVEESYALYVDMNGGRSARHPDNLTQSDNQ